MATRSARDSESRGNAERVQQWRPGSALDAPEPPIGFKHRWIRESVMEYDDKTTFIKNGKRDGNLFALKSIPTMLAPSLTKEETQAPFVLAD